MKNMALPIADTDTTSPQRFSYKRVLGWLLMTTSIGIAGIVVWNANAYWRLPDNPTSLVGAPALPGLALQPPTLSPPAVLPFSLAASPGARLFPNPTVRPSARPVSIQIPTVRLNADIVPVSPFSSTTRSGEIRWEWETADYAVGHLDRTSTPGAGGNIVLAGHNNTKGEVFRDLSRLKVGETITVATHTKHFFYVVTEVTIVPYRKDPIAGETILQQYMEETNTERLTLLSCYPYWTNRDRIVVVAIPSPTSPAKQIEETPAQHRKQFS